MRYLRLMFLLGQLARLALLDTTPGGDAGGAGGGDSGGAGAEGGDAGGQAGQGGTGGGSGSTDTGQGAGGAQGGTQGAAEPTVDQLDPVAQRLIREARAEAAKNRVGRTAAEQARTELLTSLAKSLGVDVAAAEPERQAQQLQGQVQTLTGERDTLQAGNRQLTVQLAAWPAALKAGADAGALLDSASFLAKLGQLDPSAADFAAKLDTAVKDALTANPRLKAGQAPARGGFDPTGRPGGDSPASLEDAISTALARQS